MPKEASTVKVCGILIVKKQKKCTQNILVSNLFLDRQCNIISIHRYLFLDRQCNIIYIHRYLDN